MRMRRRPLNQLDRRNVACSNRWQEYLRNLFTEPASVPHPLAPSVPRQARSACCSRSGQSKDPKIRITPGASRRR